MTTTSLYNQMREILVDEGASALLKTVSSRYITYDQFVGMDLPGKMSSEAMWNLLHLLGRAGGIEVPIPDIAGNEYWYRRTHELADAVARIQCLCRADSDLYRTLTLTQNRSILVQSRVDETIAAAALDGLRISASDVQGLLRLDRTPRNDTERLVLNSLRALDGLQELADVPFSMELFWHLRGLLLEGVDVSRIRRTAPRMGLMTSDYADEEVRAAADRQAGCFSAFMNHLAGDVHDHPVMRALLIPDIFRYYRPLPDMNSEVGRLAFRLYALKVGLPVLGMLPLSRAKLDWEDGRLDESVVWLQPDVYMKARSHDAEDLTSYYTLSVQLALVALQDLNWELYRLEKQDSELRALLQRDPEINHRQRSILGRALRNPTAEFRIAYHKNTHNVVYATARADLLELADKGFLVLGKQGRAMVFTPRPGLRQFIEESYGAE